MCYVPGPGSPGPAPCVPRSTCSSSVQPGFHPWPARTMSSRRQVPGPGGWVVDVGGGQAPSARAQNVSGGRPSVGSHGVVRANFSLTSATPESLRCQRHWLCKGEAGHSAVTQKDGLSALQEACVSLLRGVPCRDPPELSQASMAHAA